MRASTDDTVAGEPRPRVVRRPLLIALLVIGAAAVLAVAWVGIRSALAAGSLQQVEESAGALAAAADGAGEADGLTGLLLDSGSEVSAMAEHASTAASLVGDPIWMLAESVPMIGGNLTGLRVGAEEADALLGAASSLFDAAADADGLFEDGVIDLGAVERLAALLQATGEELDASITRLEAVDTSGMLPQLRDDLTAVRGFAATASERLGPIRAFAEAAGTMLGADAPQSYLVLFLTPAELRASGGLPGASAVFTLDRGIIERGDVYSTRDFDPVPAAPLIPLTATELALYGDRPARFIQDATATEDFGRTAAFASALTAHHHGLEPSGVLAIDVVALGYLLEAIGPVDLDDGERLDAVNAADLLMNGVYLRYPDPADQDAYFGAVIDRAFDAAVSRRLDPVALLGAASRAADEGRLLAWSSLEPVQGAIVGTAGAETSASPPTTVLGVHLNDRTSAKMDYYLEAAAEVTWAACDSGSRLDRVETTLANTVDPAVVPSLPWYVTGDGGKVPKGVIATQVVVTGPVGATVRSSGQDHPAAVLRDELDRPRVVWTVETAPDEEATRWVVFASTGGGAASELARTPAVAMTVNESHGELSESCQREEIE